MGEGALRVEIPTAIDPRSLSDALYRVPGVLDVVITERHALVVFDPTCAPPEIAPVIERATHAKNEGLKQVHTLSVRYDGEDMESVCALCNVDREGLIAMHTAPVYTVRMVGFMPGFAYLGDVDLRLRVPRREVPRPRVPAGAVAIAGARTGVYPFASPGGWHLLGSLAEGAMFDPVHGSRLRVGDRVRLIAV